MAVVKGPGRPPKDGPRYPCGKRRPTGDVRGHIIWQRIAESRERAFAFAKDAAIWATEIGRLHLQAGVLNLTQASTAFHIAKTWDRYRYYQDLRTSARSADIGAAPAPDEVGESSPRELTPAEMDERRVAATEAWLDLQALLPPGDLRSAIEQLCCENRAINPTLYDGVTALLDFIANERKIKQGDKKPIIRASSKAVQPRRGAQAVSRYEITLPRSPRSWRAPEATPARPISDEQAAANAAAIAKRAAERAKDGEGGQ